MVHSYDIFDTCLLRKCGSPINFFDVLSFRVFSETPTESERQEFICFRLKAEGEINSDGTATLKQIYNHFSYSNPKLKEKKELYLTELECEKDMLVPSSKIREEIYHLHKEGQRIIFISDMYLPSSFLRERLIQFGFFYEGDKIYVSCENGKSKASGTLFDHIKRTENVEFSEWIHHGDNQIADVDIPKKLGIGTVKVCHSNTHYQKKWLTTDFTLKYKSKSIAAGLSKSVLHSNKENSHSAFAIDIIAPFYSSWTYRIFKDASEKGIKRIYFCSRDSYQQYQIAQIIQERLFPNIECKYLYISRQSVSQSDRLTTLQYFIQEGLACHEEVAIVDTRTQGRTQYLLNELFTSNGYNSIRAYYFIVFPCNEIKYKINYVAEINRIYAYHNQNIHNLLVFEQEGPIYEIFFSMNNTPRTIGYTKTEEKFCPYFEDTVDNDGFVIRNADFYTSFYAKLLHDYIIGYIDTGLYQYSDYIFEDVSISSINDFFSNPRKEYLIALTDLHYKNSRYIPYVSPKGILTFVKTRGRNSIWRKGTLANILPEKLFSLCIKLKKVAERTRGQVCPHVPKRILGK